nr:hypothetical protein Iba_chr09dCG0180 [Ipomoea batatas]
MHQMFFQNFLCHQHCKQPHEAPFKVDVVSDARCHERVFAAAGPTGKIRPLGCICCL